MSPPFTRLCLVWSWLLDCLCLCFAFCLQTFRRPSVHSSWAGSWESDGPICFALQSMVIYYCRLQGLREAGDLPV